LTQGDPAAAFRRLATELETEIEGIDRVVGECEPAARSLSAESTRLELYGAAALLHNFYSAVERALLRVAAATDGGPPGGPAWHRALLDIMTRAIPSTRPSVLGAEAAQRLHPYLSFRHRFRNLYLFDLEPERITQLLAQVSDTWKAARADLDAFRSALLALAAP
jgi:hypothetical protein